MTITEPAATSTATAGRPHVQVLADRCAGCEECVVRCPTRALSMDADRWIARADDERCVGCRQCSRTCPFSAIVVEGPLLVGPRLDPEPVRPGPLLGSNVEVRSGLAGWDEALAEAARCLQCPDPTCTRGCPAHNDIPGFVAAVLDRDLERAHAVLRRTSVLPDVCARVCNQAAQCEGACSWSLAGGTPVSIGRLERFITENLPVPPPARVAPTGLSVGIVGSGPAAAGAAWELVEAGASVTVYEKDAMPGGLCIWGMPGFTLPDDVAARPWVQLVEAGVDLRCGTEIRPEDIDGLLDAHDGVIMAYGAGSPLRLPVPGVELEGVLSATTFLQGSRLALEPGGDPAAFLAGLGLPTDVDGEPGTGPQVLVLGAGNTAMDVARSARRLGLRATCVDWLDERFCLTRPDELAEARHEGVDVRFGRTLIALHGDGGRVVAAELARTVQDSAARRPKVRPGDPEALRVDLVVTAMGYRIDPAFAEALPGTPIRREATGVPDRRWTASGILANPASAFANNSPVGELALGREVGLWSAALPRSPRLWTAGDALIGPGTVVEAMSQGRRAAAALLDAQPSRPGGPEDGRTRGLRRVLVCYESVGGTTARAAHAIGDHVSAQGYRVRVLPIDQVGPAELASADALVVGTWVEGLVVAGVHPAKAMRRWLAGLPPLAGRPAAVFCTYGIAPRTATDELNEALERRGAVVVAQAAFASKELKDGSDGSRPRAFAEELAGRLRVGVAAAP